MGEYNSEKWLDRIRGQECVMASKLSPEMVRDGYGCCGKVSPHHMGHGYYKGSIKRHHDFSTIPLCFRHHRQIEDMGRPSFENFYSLELRDVLIDILVEATRETY